MSIVSMGNGFKFQGVVYQKGDPIPEEVLKKVPPYILEIHLGKRVIAEMSDDDAKLMRYERGLEKEEAAKRKVIQMLERKKLKVKELTSDLSKAETRNSSLNAAIKRLKSEIKGLEPKEEKKPEVKEPDKKAKEGAKESSGDDKKEKKTKRLIGSVRGKKSE